MTIRPMSRLLPLLAVATLAAGCSTLGDTMMTTASIPEPPKVDPACITLTAQIDTLRKDGIAEKIEKAANKKYRMTPLDLAKADQLNKANADFQARCSTLTPKPPVQQTAAVQPSQAPAQVQAPAAAPAAQ